MRWQPVILPIVLVSSGLLVSGCVASIVAASTTAASDSAKTSGTKVDQAQIDKFQKGVTTTADVQKTLGQPQQTTPNPNGGQTLTYTSKDAVGNAQSHVAFARWASGSETTITTRNVVFVFDSAGLLSDTNATESSFTCKFGKCPD